MQEKRGLLFCKEDRAILCRDCDVSVHTASELTMRHTRFLLTGVRLSAEPAACPSPPSDDENSSDGLCCSAGNGNVTRILVRVSDTICIGYTDMHFPKKY